MSVYQFRKDKDAFLASDPHSPLAGQEFSGLRYFPVSDALVFRPRLQLFEEQTPQSFLTSTGDEKVYRRFAEVSFVVEGVRQRLTLFALSDDAVPAVLFVPFKDKTSGVDSYGAGRYLEVAFDPDEPTVLLDFNYAYSPYCAYSDRYSCPFPPVENHLTVPIRAGEMTYK